MELVLDHVARAPVKLVRREGDVAVGAPRPGLRDRELAIRGAALGQTPERLPRRSHQRVDAITFAQRVIAWRQELGNRLLSEFVTTSRALEHAFEQVAPDDWETLCYRPNGAEPQRRPNGYHHEAAA